MSIYPWQAEAGAKSSEEQLHPSPTPRIKTLTDPAVEPVTAAELAMVLKVSAEDEGEFLTALLLAARVWCENWTGRFFVTRTAELWLDFWPASRQIDVPASPLSAVATVSIYDNDDTATILDATTYQVDLIGEPARIVLKAGVTAPTDLRPANGVVVSFTAGYGATAASVPENIKTAIRMMAAEVYLARGSQVDAKAFSRNGMASPDALLLLEPYKVIR